MHDGRFRSLQAVLKHYSEPQTNAKVMHQVKTVFPLSANDQVDIIAFLKTLNDAKFVFNKNHSFQSNTGINE
jgi:cytochrome c peroxidase